MRSHTTKQIHTDVNQYLVSITKYGLWSCHEVLYKSKTEYWKALAYLTLNCKLQNNMAIERLFPGPPRGPPGAPPLMGPPPAPPRGLKSEPFGVDVSAILIQSLWAIVPFNDFSFHSTGLLFFSRLLGLMRLLLSSLDFQRVESCCLGRWNFLRVALYAFQFWYIWYGLKKNFENW